MDCGGVLASTGDGTVRRGVLTSDGTARVASVLIALLCALPLIGIFTIDGFGWIYRVLLIALMAGSVWSPRAGLVSLVVFLPMSAALQVLSGAGRAGLDMTDTWLLAFVAGTALRVLPSVLRVPSALAMTALVFGVVVVTSTVVELAAMQAVVPRRPLAPELWQHVTTDFWIDQGRFAPVHPAVRWLAWLLTAISAERIVAGWPEARERLVRLWVLGGAAGAVFVAVRVVEILLQSDRPTSEALAILLTEARLSVLHPDFNAAGSYFVLFLAPALALAWQARRDWIWLAGAPLLMVGFALARSRAAMGALVLTLAVAWSRAMIDRRRMMGLVTGGVAAVAVLAAASALTARSNVGLQAAFDVRADLTRVAARTIVRFPMFGVGLSDYIAVSRRQISEDMLALRHFAPQGENAHNNYLQIAGELGIPAGALFLLIVVPVVRSGWKAGTGTGASAMALGLIAFLVSALFGHPLLVPLVGAGFFLALGTTAGLARAATPVRPWLQTLLLAAALFYVLSLSWRL